MDTLKIFEEIDKLSSDVLDLHRTHCKNIILLFDRYSSIAPNHITPRKFVAEAKIPLNVTINMIGRLIEASSKNIAKEYKLRFVSDYLIESSSTLTQPLFAQMSYDVMLVKSDITRMSIEVTNRESNGESKDSAFIAAKKNLNISYAGKMERKIKSNYVEIMTRHWAMSSIYGAFANEAKKYCEQRVLLTNGEYIDVSQYDSFSGRNLLIYPDALPQK